MSARKLAKIALFPEEANHMDLSQNTLLSTLLNDPSSRAMVLQFMSQAQKDLKYKEDQVKKVANKLKKHRFLCESPTAQFRRKELARLDCAHSDSESSSTCSTIEQEAADTPKVPFNELLRGLIIYVEVFSNGLDKSFSAKALVQSMGAKVNDRIGRGVTHVIFKDGSYQTYQLARRLKLHVVSILWLQAVKRKGNVVPEKDYPAFGTDQGDLNVSTMCKNLHAEFEDICKDERGKINSSTLNKPVVSTPKSNQTIKNSSKIPSNFHTGDDSEDEVFLSAKSSKTTASSVLSSASTKKSIASSTKLPISSDIDLVDEEASNNLNNSLELTPNIVEISPAPKSNRNRRRTLYNPEDNSILEINMSKNKRKTMFAIPVLRESNRDSHNSNTSLESLRSKENSMELTCLNDTSNNIKSDENNPIKLNATPRRSTASLETNNSINSSTRSSMNSNSMDLTSFANTRRRSVRIASKSEEMFKKPIIRATESKESSFSDKLSCLRLSTESDKRQSIESNPQSTNESIKQSDISTSSLRLSDIQQAINKEEDNQVIRKSNESCTDSQIIDKHVPLQSENLTSSLRLSDSHNKTENTGQLNDHSKCLSTDSNNDKRVSFIDNDVLQSENLTSSLRLSETEKSNNKSETSELMGELSQLRLDTSKNSTKENIPKKRLSDEQDLTPSKKTRQEKPRLVSESSSNDESGRMKSRRLYDVDDPSHDELIVQISSVNLNKPKPNIVKGRVRRAMELIAKPFELTPETGRGKVKSISTDEESDNNITKKNNNNKTGTRKRLTKVRPVKVTKNEKIAACDEAKAPTHVFATPKTPKKPPLTPSRKSSRFTTPVTYKKFYDDDKTSSMNESLESNDSVITPKLNRRSTMDFSTPMSTTSSIITQKTDSAGKKGLLKSGIACTRFKVGRVNTFSHIVRRLGRFHIDDNVVARTTHLVVGENKRTVNILRAIARGCWILSSDWLYHSMTAGKWLPEEDFEFTDFSEAVQFCRKERQAFGPTYTADTFASCGPIYIARRGTKPSGDELRELVRLAGGTIAPVARSATVVVGEVVKRYDTVRWCVSEPWVLDSIMRNQVENCADYSLMEHEEEGGGMKERRLSEDF